MKYDMCICYVNGFDGFLDTLSFFLFVGGFIEVFYLGGQLEIG